MVEIWLATRDSIGINSTVIYEYKEVLIKDLPRGLYDVNYKEQKNFRGISPIILPWALLDYCAELDAQEEDFRGRIPHKIVSDLEFLVKKC